MLSKEDILSLNFKERKKLHIWGDCFEIEGFWDLPAYRGGRTSKLIIELIDDCKKYSVINIYECEHKIDDNKELIYSGYCLSKDDLLDLLVNKLLGGDISNREEELEYNKKYFINE